MSAALGGVGAGVRRRRIGAAWPVLMASLLPIAAPVAVRAAGAQQTAAAPGQGGEALERQVRDVAARLRCPVCQGLSVDDSQAELAVEMKALIREQLAAGRSPEEVEAYFVSKYGEWVLLEPKPEGFNLALYLLPLAALLAGAVVVATIVRRWSAAPPLEPH